MKIETALSKKRIVGDGCMITYTGEIIDLFKPFNNHYDLRDIAHGLAFTCRWNGATKTYYSVAEHCCQLFDLAEQMGDDSHELMKTALFHDCEEAYWGDIIKPLKNMLPQNIQEAMANTRNAIFFLFKIKPICEIIENFDSEALQWDFTQLILSDNHKGWDCYRAEKEWLKRAEKLLYNSIPKSIGAIANQTQ